MIKSQKARAEGAKEGGVYIYWYWRKATGERGG